MFGWVKNLGLTWKVQLAPAVLIVALVGVGGYALQNLKQNRADADALIAGPVRQSELAGELNSTLWEAHAKLYRLAATAANETDDKKIQAAIKEASGGRGQDSGRDEGGRSRGRSDQRQAGSVDQAEDRRRRLSEAIQECDRNGRWRSRLRDDVHQGRRAPLHHDRPTHRRRDAGEQREPRSRGRALRDQARAAAVGAAGSCWSRWR